ncbi:MAG: PAS domain S-box protein [Gemmatimonadota bacterium]|nr:PAS domain S-box protein [Gemmatimonadota bacterium]
MHAPVVQGSLGLVSSGVDIRTKLIFWLLAVSLGSMVVLSAIVSPRVDGYIVDGALQRLAQVAEGKQEALRWIVAGWGDGTDLVASRTQLRASLDEYARTSSSGAADRIDAILSDALDASRNATLLQVFTADGRSVASVRRGSPMSALSADSPPTPPPPGDAVYAGVTIPPTGPPQVTFLASMTYQGQSIGTLVAVLEAPELVDLTGGFNGLGDTGETLILLRDERGEIRPLHPTRHPAGPDVGRLLSDPTSLGSRALAGDAQPLAGGVTDYRGVEVWAATRLVDKTGWGLVVKIDQAEVQQPVLEFDAWLRQTAIILSAFAIVLGLVLALRVALPIHALAEAANRIRAGEMDARAHVSHEDEIGLLARTFNGMADDLEQRIAQLREFRRFFDVSIDLMCIAGTDGYFKRTNPAFEHTLGWTEEELLERPFFDLVHPDDVESTEMEVAKLADGIPTISFENRFRCKDGTYKWLLWNSYPDRGVLYAIARVLNDSPTARTT